MHEASKLGGQRARESEALWLGASILSKSRRERGLCIVTIAFVAGILGLCI